MMMPTSRLRLLKVSPTDGCLLIPTLKTAEEETATIEEIDGSEEESMNIIESATIKEEPDVTKIGADGIDHSALEGMVNLCER